MTFNEDTCVFTRCHATYLFQAPSNPKVLTIDEILAKPSSSGEAAKPTEETVAQSLFTTNDNKQSEKTDKESAPDVKEVILPSKDDARKDLENFKARVTNVNASKSSTDLVAPGDLAPADRPTFATTSAVENGHPNQASSDKTDGAGTERSQSDVKSATTGASTATKEDASEPVVKLATPVAMADTEIPAPPVDMPQDNPAPPPARGFDVDPPALALPEVAQDTVVHTAPIENPEPDLATVVRTEPELETPAMNVLPPAVDLIPQVEIRAANTVPQVIGLNLVNPPVPEVPLAASPIPAAPRIKPPPAATLVNIPVAPAANLPPAVLVVNPPPPPAAVVNPPPLPAPELRPDPVPGPSNPPAPRDPIEEMIDDVVSIFCALILF